MSGEVWGCVGNMVASLGGIGDVWGMLGILGKALGEHLQGICRSLAQGLQGTCEESVGMLLGIARELQRNWEESAGNV